MLSLSGDPGVEFFEAKVRPLLAAKCFACHSAKLASPMGGLRFDDPRIARSMVKPKEAEASRLIQAVRYQTIGMPPGGKLKDEEIATLTTFLRNAWTNKAPEVTARDVEAIRKLGNTH